MFIYASCSNICHESGDGTRSHGRRTKGTTRMNAMLTSTDPTGLRVRHVSLTTGLAAAAEARAQVREIVRAWQVPVDAYVAALLTSELVTNAVRNEANPTVTLDVTCSAGRLRVDVHDTSPAMPAPADAPAGAESGRGLIIVGGLADEWGFYATRGGKAVYFTLAFRSGGSAK
jgi:anti-sigma regulatory factor (Ser/Thr protein kinase)